MKCPAGGEQCRSVSEEVGTTPPPPAAAGITATQVPQPREQALPLVLPGPSIF